MIRSQAAESETWIYFATFLKFKIAFYAKETTYVRIFNLSMTIAMTQFKRKDQKENCESGLFTRFGVAMIFPRSSSVPSWGLLSKRINVFLQINIC